MGGLGLSVLCEAGIPQCSQLFLRRLSFPLPLRNDEKLDLQWTLEGHQLGVVSVDISHTGAIAASSSLDAHIRLWDLETGKQIKSIDAGPGETPVLSWLCRRTLGLLLANTEHWGIGVFEGIKVFGGFNLFCICRNLSGFLNSTQSSIRPFYIYFYTLLVLSQLHRNWLFAVCMKQNGNQLALTHILIKGYLEEIIQVLIQRDLQRSSEHSS